MADSVGALAPAVTGGQARGLFGPIRGTRIAIPVFGSTPAFLDLRGNEAKHIRISSIAEDLLYVFTTPLESMDYTGVMITAFATDFTEGVPDIIWECTSDRIVVPPTHPILLMTSATATVGEVRVRRG